MMMSIMRTGPKQLVAVFFTAELWSKVVISMTLHVFIFVSLRRPGTNVQDSQARTRA
jgi:hypothetical protein